MSTDDGLYWQTGVEDEAMQNEHGFIWRAMLDTIDLDPAGKKVLDVGCNRGGFLRLLYDECGIAAGFGYDPASGAIADALTLAADRPLVFEVAETVPSPWQQFDLAFSHEVLYLIHDLAAHAAAIQQALAPGGVYYAVTGVHAATPNMAEWHAGNVERLQLPSLYTLDEVIALFGDAGFESAAARLKFGFVPASSHARSFPSDLQYLYDHKFMLRFKKPAVE